MQTKYFERFMLVFATVEPIATIPQIIEVWKHSNTEGVSMLTWFFYTLTSCIWLVYGITRKDKPLIVSGILWVASQGLVVLGLLLAY
jgi:uncharacterized protein with PQ loop repeat